MQENNPTTIHLQKVSESERYLVGPYAIEILTLPRIQVRVDVTPNGTAYVDIFAPGSLQYRASKSMVAQLFVVRDNGELEWVYTFQELTKNHTLSLQPGNYRLVYRPKTLKSSSYTIEKEFRIISNKTTVINI
jgi:Ca-activated chloride channel family protein